MADSQKRIELLKVLRERSGLTLDFWADITEGLTYRSLAILCGNSALLPKKRYSKVKL